MFAMRCAADALFGFLAPRFVTKVLDTLQRIRAGGVTVLLVEQNLHQALKIYLQATGTDPMAVDAASRHGRPGRAR